MMNNSNRICITDLRRHAVRESTKYNGLDYLEVIGKDQKALIVRFLEKAPENITVNNIKIEGGRRVRNIKVESVKIVRCEDSELDDCLKIFVDKAGDFSTYTLRMVAMDEKGRPTDNPFPGFDPRYAYIKFSFKADCPTDLDCKSKMICPVPERNDPEINYLTKDYASFRQLILDRLALLIPDWQERHVPDVGITLVELLAYVGDYLSYYQDAVMTEAYLGTARRRISVQLTSTCVYPFLRSHLTMSLSPVADRTASTNGFATERSSSADRPSKVHSRASASCAWHRRTDYVPADRRLGKDCR